MLFDDGLRAIDGAGALRLRAADDLLEIVEVVEVNGFELADAGFDVARDGDVDDEDRAISPGLVNVLELLAREDRPAGAG